MYLKTLNLLLFFNSIALVAELADGQVVKLVNTQDLGSCAFTA
jgi:hypothetical protein